MILYIIIEFFLLIGVFFGILRYKSNGKVLLISHGLSTPFSLERSFFLVFILLFTFLTAMRSIDIGNDTVAYVRIFNGICKYGANNNFEYGFELFCSLISKISTDPHLFLIITAVFCYGLIGIYSWFFSSNLYITTCLIFCICFSPLVNILRQDIAMVICLFAYQALKKGNLKFFFILVLLACQFHTTALCMLSLLFTKFFPSNKKSILFIGVALVIASCFGNLGGLLGSITKYGDYFESSRVGTGWLATTIGLLEAFFIFFIVIDSSFFSSKKNVAIYSNFWALVFFTSLGFQMNLFNRCALYFLFIAITEIPNAMVIIKGNRVFYNIFLLCFAKLFLFLFILIIRPEWNNLVPYRMW